MKWVRAKDGALFGVVKGLAKSLDMPVGLFRLVWLASILFFGFGVLLYLMLALSLPREDRVDQASEPWILGVCTQIAKRTQSEVGVIRFLTIALAFVSMGATLIGYIVMYFVLDDDKKPNQSGSSSDNKPTTPLSTL